MANRVLVPTMVYNPPGGGLEFDPHKAADDALAKRVVETLEYHYPGYPWKAEIDHGQGVVMIAIPQLMGLFKYLVKIWRIKSDPTLECIMKAGGAILEVYKLPRRAYSETHFGDAVGLFHEQSNKTKRRGWLPGV